ncbi:MAG: hypothetical protein ACPL5I_05655 [Thermodesulfobacteriota bacterium]
MLCLGGCLYQLALEKPQGTYLSLNLKSYPLAIAPALDAPGFPESGKILTQSLHDILKEKGFSLIGAQDGVVPSASSMATLEANNLPEKLGTNFLLIGSILEYAQEASAIGSAGFPAWQGTHDEYIFLPTYRQGYCQLRIKLTLWNLENKTVFWEREGKISGPSFARQPLLRRLLRHLCADFPP